MNQAENWLLQEKYHGQPSADFAADRQRLAAGEPLAYVIGHIPFLDCQIYLDSRPLIPRPETEYWTQRVRETWSDQTQRRSLQILDLCAGSGCIGIALAKSWPNATVTFAELDPAHLPTIKKNVAANLAYKQSTAVIQSDLFAAITGRFDLIVANPPYIDPALDRTDQAVLDHEPTLALYGGEAGFDCLRTILEQAPAYLVPGGQLWLEHEPEQVALVRENAASFATVVTHNDQYLTPRFSVLSVAL